MPVATRPRTVMSLGDVAALARVSRPVVSMWRERLAVDGVEHPFPEAVEQLGRAERFDTDDVVRWLAQTGRGKNPGAPADAAAHAVPLELLKDGEPDTAALDGAQALLCLRTITGADLGPLDGDDLLDLAEAADPDDDFLFTEIASLGAGAIHVGGWIDDLVDAAYGPVPALERLTARRRFTPSQRRAQLRCEGAAAMAEIAAALVAELGEGAVVCDATEGPTDLLGAVMGRLGDGADVAVRMRTRPGRRRACIAGWNQDDSSRESDLFVAQFPTVDRPNASAEHILQALDDLQLDLNENQWAVFLAPAEVLCDSLDDAALDGMRSSILRLGRLRAAVRLPRGLLVGSPRQALGLWVLGPERDTAPLDHRWVATADLGDTALTPEVLSDLATDIVSAMGDRTLGRAHAFRFARVSMTAGLLAGGGAIVPVGVRPIRLNLVSPASITTQVTALLTQLADATRTPNAVSHLRVEPSASETGMPSCSVATALASGALKVAKGVRFDPDLEAGGGAVRLLGVEDLIPPGATRRGVDPLEVEARHPAARRTEPGDVVFGTTPRPAAIVDRDGYAFLAYPARVLRCRPGSGLVPEAVAAAINAQAASSRDWKAWPIPRVHPADADALAAALRAVEDEERAAYARLSLLHDLTTRLVDGFTSRAITVSNTDATEPVTTKGR